MSTFLFPSWCKRVSLALLAVPLLDVVLPGTLGGLSPLMLAAGVFVWFLSAEVIEDERTAWCRTIALRTAAMAYAAWVGVWLVVLGLNSPQAIPSALCGLPLVLVTYALRFYYELRFKPSQQS